MTGEGEVFKGRIVTVRMEKAVLPDGKVRLYEVVRHPGGAAVVAVDAAGRVALIRQWRHAADAWLWEVPAGKLDVAGETPLETAARELGEEAGLAAERWESLGAIVSTPGFSDEVLHLFLARGLSETPIAHDEGEFIELKWFPYAQALKMAESGEITDAKTVVALFRAAGRVAGGENA